MPTIRDLIRESLAAGKSVRDLEADSGFQVKFQTFQELSNSAPKQFPKKAETVLGMAKALQVSEAAVVLAYAAGLGIPVSARSEFALRLPAGVDAIDGTMQKALISVVRAALAQGAADGMETTTEPDAPSQADANEKNAGRNNVRDLKQRKQPNDLEGAGSRPRIPEWWDLHRLAREALEDGVSPEMARAWPNIVENEVKAQSRALGLRDVGEQVDVNALTMQQFRELSWAVVHGVRDRVTGAQLRDSELPRGVGLRLRQLSDNVDERSDAARTIRGKTRGQVEYEDHATAGEEPDASGPESGA